MEKIKYVEVKCYNPDWGTIFTDSIWVGTGEVPEALNSKNESFDGMEVYCGVLKKAGFKKLETVKIEFGGNL